RRAAASSCLPALPPSRGPPGHSATVPVGTWTQRMPRALQSRHSTASATALHSIPPQQPQSSPTQLGCSGTSFGLKYTTSLPFHLAIALTVLGGKSGTAEGAATTRACTRPLVTSPSTDQASPRLERPA